MNKGNGAKSGRIRAAIKILNEPTAAGNRQNLYLISGGEIKNTPKSSVIANKQSL